MGADFIDVIDGYFTCEFSTWSRTESPQTWPLAARLLPDGRFLLFTSIGMPQKAFNIRRDPKVSLLFSNPTGSGVANPGAVLIQGDATAEDRIVTDMTADPELAAHLETICARQPASSFMSSWLGRRMLWSYYIRILVYVAPRRVFHWPDLLHPRASRTRFERGARRRVNCLPWCPTRCGPRRTGQPVVSLPRREAVGSAVRARRRPSRKARRALGIRQHQVDAAAQGRLSGLRRSVSTAATKYLAKRGLERPTVDWAAIKEIQRRAKGRRAG